MRRMLNTTKVTPLGRVLGYTKKDPLSYHTPRVAPHQVNPVVLL